MNGLLSFWAKSTKPTYRPISIWRQLSNPLTLKIHSQILPHSFFLHFLSVFHLAAIPLWCDISNGVWIAQNGVEVPLPYHGYFPSSNRARHNVNFKWLIGDNILRNQRHPSIKHYMTNVQFMMKLLSALSS